jgi:hypothetical protein
LVRKIFIIKINHSNNLVMGCGCKNKANQQQAQQSQVQTQQAVQTNAQTSSNVQENVKKVISKYYRR